MGEANIREQAIATMPRGGPDASWLDRRFQTDALEYLDRDDVPDEVKQKIIGVLDRVGTLTNLHEKYARIALKLVSDIPNPRILELGAGHGKLSAKILELHPTATVTISDLDPTSVANIAAGELGTHPRARTQVIDATAIDGHDHSYDLAVFALAFHHLPPTVACKAIAEATRVGKRFLIIDLKRQKPLSFTLHSFARNPGQQGGNTGHAFGVARRVQLSCVHLKGGANRGECIRGDGDFSSVTPGMDCSSAA
ncbi:type 11 methyltransferase [Mycobacterium tuberculosis]|nr:type 11 methyltransferase [Mycobacterium tuberculosis]